MKIHLSPAVHISKIFHMGMWIVNGVFQCIITRTSFKYTYKCIWAQAFKRIGSNVKKKKKKMEKNGSFYSKFALNGSLFLENLVYIYVCPLSNSQWHSPTKITLEAPSRFFFFGGGGEFSGNALKVARV